MPWTRIDTKLWLHEVSLKLEAYESYLNDAQRWIEDNEITNERQIVILKFLTMLWVGYQFGEPVSKQQAFELLQTPQWEEVEDIVYSLPPKYGDLDHRQLLELASSQDYSQR
jgi:hypothetical protein